MSQIAVDYAKLCRLSFDIANSLNNDFKSISREEANQKLRALLPSVPGIVSLWEQAVLYQLVLDELFGWGVLGSLIRDPSVQVVRVITPSGVWVELNTKKKASTPFYFRDEAHVWSTVGRNLGGRVVDGRVVVEEMVEPNLLVLVNVQEAEKEKCLLVVRKLTSSI